MPDAKPLLAVVSLSSSRSHRAEAIANQTGSPFLQMASMEECFSLTSSRYLLVFDDSGVSLCPTSRKEGGPVKVDFIDGKSDHRRKYGGGTGQLVAKAVGLKPGVRPRVFDATAGLGQDAFVLATLGCEVLAMERSPVVHALLADGIDRAYKSADQNQRLILDRMTVLSGDAVEWMHLQKGAVADVIYLDPMFPEREKSSLVKKEMRYFKRIVGADGDASELLAQALMKANYRVVVKRPRLAPAIIGLERTLSVEGKSSRYDIYALRSMDELKGRAC